MRLGRRGPVQLTEARVRTICAKVAAGVPQGAAAASVGIPRRTLQNWLAAGREPDAPEPYASFADRLETALAKFHAGRAVFVTETGDARTTLQVLERRFPEDWALPDRAGTTINVLQVQVEREELSARLGSVLARFPEAEAAVLAVLGGADVVEGEFSEVKEIGE